MHDRKDLIVEERPSFCRYCVGQCAVLIDVDTATDQAVGIRGDKSHPLTQGYACVKGLQGVYALNAPDRIRRPLKRLRSGEFAEIPLAQALDEIAGQIRSIMEEDGPSSIAVFKGTQMALNVTQVEMVRSWMKALGSQSLYSTATIDQSAKYITQGRLGSWLGDKHHMLDSDIAMIVGANPLLTVSVMGSPSNNVTKQYKQMKARGLKLIVVDPRRTDTANLADLYLPIRPGEDAVLFAGLIREVLANGWEDREFCELYVSGMEQLRAAVEPFTIDMVANRTGLPADHIRLAARMFAHDAKRGSALTSTGTAMSSHSNLTEHMIEDLNVICGRFNRAGDIIRNPGLIAPREYRAEVCPPHRAWTSGHRTRVRGLGSAWFGGESPTPAIPEEILTPGAGRMRALIVAAGNPATTMPDHLKTVQALKALDLLVAIEPYMTATARLAHYILPPTLQYERSDLLLGDYEAVSPVPFQSYVRPVVSPPPDAEVIDDWRVFYELARRLDLDLDYCGEPLSMDSPPTSEQLLARSIKGPISLDELKLHPRGKSYDESANVVVQPGSNDGQNRFEVMPDDVLGELEDVLRNGQTRVDGYTHRLVTRRTRELLNSLGTSFPALRKRIPYNAAYMHPDDLASIGAATGDYVEISSDHSNVRTRVAADDRVRLGVISMAHGWGGLPGDGDSYEQKGANINQLMSVDRDVENINGMPRMSGIPVNVRLVNASAESRD